MPSGALVLCVWILGYWAHIVGGWMLEKLSWFACGRYAGCLYVDHWGGLPELSCLLMLLLWSSLPHVWFCKRRRLLNMILTCLDADTQSISIFYFYFFKLICHNIPHPTYLYAINHAGFYDSFAFLYATGEEKVPHTRFFFS